MDQKILIKHNSIDTTNDSFYAPIFTSENSFKNFVKNLKIIFDRTIEINSTEGTYYYEFSEPEITSNYESYIIALDNCTSYDLLLTFKSKVYDSEFNEIFTKNKTYYNTIKMPLFVGYKGKSPIGDSNITNEKCSGGDNITNNGIRRRVINRKDLSTTTPKAKEKDNVFKFSFTSIPLRFLINNYKVQYFKLELSNINNFKFNLQSNQYFINSNIILLICLLTNFSVYQVMDYTLKIFDKKLSNEYKIWFLLTKNLLPDNIEESEAIKKYFEKEVKESSTKKDLELLIKNFLPHLDSKIKKGIFLISILRQFFVAYYQNDVYPSRDSMIGKKISPIGITYEEKILADINSIINKEITEKLNKKAKITDILFNLNLEQKINTTFTNVFNLKDITTKKVVKPITNNVSAYADIHMSHQVAHSGSLILTKNLDARNVEPSTICFEDVVDTPDNSENVGLIKRINISTRITDYTLEEHKKLYNDLLEVIYETIEVSYDFSNKEVICSIVDYSEFPITLLTQDETLKLFNKLLKYKRHNYNNLKFIGLELIPVYTYVKSRESFLPTNKIFQLKINISCKRYYKPFIIVNNGEPEISKLDPKILENQKEMSIFYDSNPNIIEYLDAGQIAYSNIFWDLKHFKNLPLEQRKLYNYIDLSGFSNLGLVTISSYGLNHMLGTRGTFISSQQKQILLQASPDCYNKYDSGGLLINPYERPCVTNSILEITGISSLGKGHHVIVAFMSYVDNIEDGLIFRQSSVDRGFLDAATLSVFKTVTLSSFFNVNDPMIINNSYKKLNKYGIPDPITTVLTKKDAIHKKVNVIHKNYGKNDTDFYYDNSEPYNHNTPGRVMRVEKSGSDNIKTNILTSSYKPAVPGDKFVLQCGQKGTAVVFLQDHEMPRTEDGIIPDVIINSVSIVSRQTFALYLQLIFTKLYSMFPIDENHEFSFRELSPFTTSNIEEILSEIITEYKTKLVNIKDETKILNHLYCNSTMYDFMGKKISENIMIGPIMYNRAPQMGIDLATVRNTGRLNNVGNPVGGKKKGGGQKNGEMEIDVLISHGAANILNENTSDVVTNNVNSYICTNCSTYCTKRVINKNENWYCINCENKNLVTTITTVNHNQAFKVTKELLKCRGIDMTFNFKPEKTFYSIDSVN